MSEQPITNVYTLPSDRPETDGSQIMDEHTDVMFFKSDELTGGKFNREAINKTLASAMPKEAEPSAEVIMISKMMRLSSEVVATREDHMEISDRSFLKAA